VPVLLDRQDEPFIPRPLSGHTHYLLSSEDNYGKLYDFLTGQAGVMPGKLGPLRTRAREAVEPLRFDVSDLSARQLPLSNLPDRNPFFTGREVVLAQLQEALAAQGRAALSGLGGLGKTETALEYAYLHLDEYDYTFWTNADSREAIASDYAIIAGLLGLSLTEAQDQTFTVNAVKHWLSSHQDWLLILDNADDLATAGKFIPSGQNGHVLLTTRARAVGPIAQRIFIEKMGSEEGALFLLRRAKGIAKDTPLEAVVEVDRVSVDEITSELGGLPLALDQAASYIEETGCGLSGYLDL
jgi:hypothetical protein